MPEIRAFRALRYNRDSVPDLAAVVAPPYDVISPERRAALAARDPRNVVLVDLPVDADGVTDPDEKYRQAARTFNGWRSDGTLAKDRLPALYVCEQAYALPGSGAQRVQRGFYGRLRLEPFGSGGGVLPHERTMSGPKEDRHKLMRATGANLSGVVGLYVDGSGRTEAILDEAMASPCLADVTDDDGVRHRLWSVPDEGATAEAAAALRAAAEAGPITIADGHHRYETALRYRDERRLTRSPEPDPAYDFVLMLFLEATCQPITVLPTHRVVGGLADAGTGLLGALRALFDVVPASRDEIATTFGAGESAPPGGGRLGVWTRAGGAILAARRAAFSHLLPPGGDAVRRLDVTILAAVLERCCGLDRSATTAGGRIAYTKSVDEALARVDGAVDGADAAFLLDPTPVAEIMAVARDGDVMPQKSTYFFPKPLTGFVLNPLEW